MYKITRSDGYGEEHMFFSDIGKARDFFSSQIKEFMKKGYRRKFVKYSNYNRHIYDKWVKEIYIKDSNIFINFMKIRKGEWL